MKRMLTIAVCVALFTGCAATIDILDILISDNKIRPVPVPVCDKESAGAIYENSVCLKYSDGTYRWAARERKEGLKHEN